LSSSKKTENNYSLYENTRHHSDILKGRGGKREKGVKKRNDGAGKKKGVYLTHPIERKKGKNKKELLKKKSKIHTSGDRRVG